MVEVRLLHKTLNWLVENKEHEERREGGGSGDWGRGELLEPGLFQSGLLSGSQSSGSYLWRLLTKEDQLIRLWATCAPVWKEPDWSTFGIILEISFKNECLMVLFGLPRGLVFFMNADIRRAGISYKAFG